MLELKAGVAATRRLEGATPRRDRVLFSPAGRIALLYYQNTQAIRTVTGLPAQPVVSDEVTLSFSSVVTALAISDRGGVLAAALEDGTGGLSVIEPDGTARFIASTGNVGAAIFLQDSADALVADNGRMELVLIRDVTGAAERRLLLSQPDFPSRVVAMAASEDNRRVLVARAEPAAEITVIDLAGGDPVAVACPCTPSAMTPLRGSTVFRLTGVSGAPMYVLDAGSPEVRVLFVPPDTGSPALDEMAVRPPRGRLPG